MSSASTWRPLNTAPNAAATCGRPHPESPPLLQEAAGTLPWAPVAPWVALCGGARNSLSLLLVRSRRFGEPPRLLLDNNKDIVPHVVQQARLVDDMSRKLHKRTSVSLTMWHGGQPCDHPCDARAT